MDVFIQWLETNGINMENIKIEMDKYNERKIVSLSNLKNKDVLMYVPNKLLIDSEKIKNSPFGPQTLNLFNNETQLVKNIISTAVFMLYSMQNYENYNTFFDPYFDTLPEDLRHIPIFWTRKELTYLKGSHILEDIKKRIKMIRAEYNKLCANLENFKMFSFYEYKRARSLVSSRNFSLNINGVENNVLVPLADMLNHSNNAKTKWYYDNTKKGYMMVLNENIEKGVEITDSYGKKENHKYFLYYGFLLENTQNVILLKTRDITVEITDNITDYGVKYLMNYLRKIFLKKGETFVNNFVNKKNEKRVIKECIVLLRRKRNKYDNNITYYKRTRHNKEQNKRNASTLLYYELLIIETLLDKFRFILNYLNGEKRKIKYDDVKQYILTLN